MKLGNFSVSLNVKDINKSVAFYENLGFSQFGGDISQNWMIMKNEQTTIGLFQGMFENNILTFNPGWDDQCNTLESFDDIREIQTRIKSNNVTIVNDLSGSASGPDNLIIEDPDGNTIMFDQHV